MEVPWKRSREFEALHSRGGHGAQQATKWGCAFNSFQAAVRFGTIAVHILTNQMNLSVAVTAKLVYLGNYVGSFPALFPAARVRHDTVSTKLVTAFDDRNKGDIFRGARSCRHVPYFAGGPLLKIDHAAFAL